MLKQLGAWGSMLMIGQAPKANNSAHSSGDGLALARSLRGAAYAQGDGLAAVNGLFNLERPFKTRGEMMTFYNEMLENTLVSTAVDYRVTSIVGGDLMSGEVVKIKVKPEFASDAKAQEIVDGLRDALAAPFNTLAWPVVKYAVTKGDAYLRVTGDKRHGIRSIDFDIPPECVLPFEKGGVTVGFLVSRNGLMSDNWAQVSDAIALDNKQMVRLKMPRVSGRFVTAFDLRRLAIDAYDDLPLIVGEAGGSLLEGSEQAYRDFVAMMSSLTNQSLLDAIDEVFLGVNTVDMTDKMRDSFTHSLGKVFSSSAAQARKVVASGKPWFGKGVKLIPVSGEKQLINLQADLGASGRKNSMTPDQVLMYAKILTSSLGVDLTQIGFATDMAASVGGDGGASTVNGNSVEDIRRGRTAALKMFNDLIDLEIYYKTGKYPTAEQRVWDVEFSGTSAAVAQKEQDLRMTAMNEAGLVVGVMAQMKDAGFSADEGVVVLSKIGKLNEAEAKALCDLLSRAPTPEGEPNAEPTDNSGGEIEEMANDLEEDPDNAQDEGL